MGSLSALVSAGRLDRSGRGGGPGAPGAPGCHGGRGASFIVSGSTLLDFTFLLACPHLVPSSFRAVAREAVRLSEWLKLGCPLGSQG